MQTVKVIETVSVPDSIPLIGPLASNNFTSTKSSTSSVNLKKLSALQIVYNSSECNEGTGVTDLTLCIITPSEENKNEWLVAIRLSKYTNKEFDL